MDGKTPEEFRKVRGQAKGNATRLMGVIDRLITDKQVEEARKRMADFERALKIFAHVHQEYVDTVNKDEDVSAEERYFNTAMEGFDTFRETTETWIAGMCKDETHFQLNESLQSSQVDQIEGFLAESEGTEQIQQQLEREREQLQKERDILRQEQELIERRRQVAEERRRIKEERLRIQAEMHRLAEEEEAQYVRQGGCTTHSTPQVSTSEQSPSQQATFRPAHASRSGRPSWDPSQIPGARDETTMSPDAAILADTLRQMLDDSRMQQQSVVDTLQLPRSELPIFTGDPLTYWPFMRAFRNTVDAKSADPGSKLTCLLQYCSGSAKKLLQSCLVMEPAAGYKHALDVLERRFGDKFTIAQAWIKKIVDRPDAKAIKDLRDFADDLHCCKQTLEAMGYEAELNNSHSMLAIVKKLPYHLQTRWLKRNHSIKTADNRTPCLGDLVDFVELAADEASDPVFGKVLHFNENKKSKTVARERDGRDKGQAGSFAVQATTSSDSDQPTNSAKRNPCPKCGQKHFIVQCPAYKAMSVKDRFDFVQAKRLCVNCYQPGHIGRDCPRPYTCPVDGCGRKHSAFLHIPRPQGSSIVAQGPATAESEPVTTNQHSNFARAQGGKLALPIVAARVRCPKSDYYVDTYAMLDTGTNATYCTETLRKRLGAAGEQRHFELTTIAQTKVPIESTVVTLRISDIEDKEVATEIRDVTVRPSLNLDLASLTSGLELQHWPHLKDLQMPSLGDDQVHLLIGQDCSDLLMPQEVRKGRPGDPFAVRTPLGWAINGPVDPFGKTTRSSHFVKSKASLEQDLETLWALEGDSLEEQGLSINDHKVLDLWKSAVSVEEGHYTLNIPFKAPPNLPDNRPMAEHRLRLLQKRLHKDDKLAERYNAEIRTLIDKQYAEKVLPEDEGRCDGRVWYLPHHPVFNPKKPDKCRIVFDCAARYHQTSLNSNVLQGPDLANKLVGVLLRFRQRSTAFMADVEAMFHQVKVSKEDRDVLRFLWWNFNDPAKPVVTYRMTSHLFGGVWSPSCANYALRKTVEDYAHDYPPEVGETVLKSFYVDDCLKSTDTENEAVAIARGTKELLAKGGFNLTKWASNSRALMSAFPQQEWEKQFKLLELITEPLPAERALGMLWDTEKDRFGFEVQIDAKPTTRRGILSTLSSIYDPMGYVSPFILKARLLFQQTCRLKIEWDESLPADLSDQWGRWMQDLPAIKEFSIPRCIHPVNYKIQSAQLHHFSDASETGYGTVSYLRLKDADDRIHTTIIMAKSRLAPIKTSTIPRLELAGALESVRLDQLLRNELEVDLQESVFWTDSTIVLWYVQNDHKRFQTYVANRVARIRKYTDLAQWRHVPTELNPGDDSSRGLTAEELLTSERWIQGPAFLRKPEAEWPSQPALCCSQLEQMAEVKQSKMVYSYKIEDDPTSKLVSFYSSWKKTKRIVAWMIRLKNFLFHKEVARGPLQASEVASAELEIIRYVQRSNLEGVQEKLPKLNPLKMQDGIWRVGGRLSKSGLPFNTKHQAIIPADHQIAKSIILHCHERTGHAGVERVLAETRLKYWIVSGRTLVKHIVYACIKCRKLRRHAENQMMGDLPESRMASGEAPFSRVGLDYFGPLFVKIARSEVKRYGCLFTCMTTRAVHIEIAHSLSTDHFINALHRFIARRGHPIEIRSDNGSNFVGAQKELKRAMDQWNKSKITETLTDLETTWIFNPPGASHMGGVWERQIRSVRNVIQGLVAQQPMQEDSLATLMTQVEGILNSRPITKLSDDPNDDSPLTPNHLLLLRAGPALPPGNFEKQDLYRSRWRQVQYLADVFWKRWMGEYLPLLQKRQKWLTPSRVLRKGDLVLLCNHDTPRNQWPLGLVVDTNAGHDGLVRSVKVKTSAGVYERPITKTCLLEGVSY